MPRKPEGDLGDLVLTMAHQACALMVGQAAAERGLFVVTSVVPGVGKSRSVEAAAVATGRPLLGVLPPPEASAQTINAEVLAAAGIVPKHGPLWETTAEAVELLDDLDAVMVVDDAHSLTPDALTHVQLLHRRARCTLGIVGGPNLARKDRRHPELFDRIDRWVTMSPLPRGAMLAALPVWHPLFGTAAPARLEDVDALYARGRWRRWRQFLTAALRYTQQGQHTLDDRTIDHVLSALGWQQRPDPARVDR